MFKTCHKYWLIPWGSSDTAIKNVSLMRHICVISRKDRQNDSRTQNSK